MQTAIVPKRRYHGDEEEMNESSSSHSEIARSSEVCLYCLLAYILRAYIYNLSNISNQGIHEISIKTKDEVFSIK